MQQENFLDRFFKVNNPFYKSYVDNDFIQV